MLSIPTRCFWFLSDYGSSTFRILSTFVVMVLAYCLAYSCVLAFSSDDNVLMHFSPSIVRPGDTIASAFVRGHFCVVTTTTLGFGDIHPGLSSPGVQLLAASQALSGYFLLGLLLTRWSLRNWPA